MSSRRCALAVGLLVWLGAALAQAASVPDAVRLYQRGSFAAARDTLVEVIDDPLLPAADHALARMYLAASYFALKDKASARLQLRLLAREHPAARLDPGLFVPELVQLSDQARAEVERNNELALVMPELDDPSAPRSSAGSTRPAQGPSSAAPSGVLLSAFGLSDVTSRSVGAGAGLLVRWGAAELGPRVLLGSRLGLGLEGGYLFGTGRVRPRAALHLQAFPGVGAFGGGPSLGARVVIAGPLAFALDASAEFLAVPEAEAAQYRATSIVVSAGLVLGSSRL